MDKKYYCGTEKKYLSSKEIENNVPLSNLLIFPPLPTSILPLLFSNKIEENIKIEETIKEELPLEILNKIIEFSDGKSLFNISQVSKEFRQLCLIENKKYKEKYLSSYYPLNNQFLNEFLTREGDEFMYEIEEEAKALYSTSFNSHSTCDPHFNHPFFWKDLFHFRLHLQPYQANPCDWIFESKKRREKTAYCDPRLCEFFRISKKTISCFKNENNKNEKYNKKEEEEERDEEEEEEDFYEVELVAITRTLHPIRLLVRSGSHPSVRNSQNSCVQFTRFGDRLIRTACTMPHSCPRNSDDYHREYFSHPGDSDYIDKNNNDNNENNQNKDNNKDYYHGRDIGKLHTIRKRSRYNFNDDNYENNNDNHDFGFVIKKKKIEFEGFESDEEDEEDKEICKKLPIFRDNDRDVPSCPCTPEDELLYDIFIWNYKKNRYENFLRKVQCIFSGCSASDFQSRAAYQWEGIFSPMYPKYEKAWNKLDDSAREKWDTSRLTFICIVLQFGLAALGSSGIPLNDNNYVE